MHTVTAVHGGAPRPTELRIGLLALFETLCHSLMAQNKFFLACSGMIEMAVLQKQQPGLLEVEVQRKDCPATFTFAHSPFSTFT